MKSETLTDKFTIEVAGLDDLDEYRHVAIQTFIDAYQHKTSAESFAKYVGESFAEKKLLAELTDSSTVVLLVRNEQRELVGYAKLRWDRHTDLVPSDRAMELERVYLLKSWWRRGLGAWLLDYCERFGAEKKFQWIWLCAWNENDSAIAFYRRQGWEPCGETEFHFGDEIHKDPVFRKRIS